MMHVTFVVFIRKRQKPHYGRLMSMGADNKHFLLLLLVLTTMKTFDIAQMESFLWCQVTGMPPMVLIITSICHVSRSLWYQHLICLMDQGYVVPCVNISMVPTLHMQCVTTHDSLPHMAWFISVFGIIFMVSNVKTLWFPMIRFGAKCHTSLRLFHHVSQSFVYAMVYMGQLSQLLWCYVARGQYWYQFSQFMASSDLIYFGSHVMFWTSQLVAPIIRKITWLDRIEHPIE